MPEQPPGPPSVAAVFDAIADTYDQTGVAFFQPVARRLVELLAPRPGDHALDAGCGRGAVTVPLAEAVGPTGHVTAYDVSPAMVGHARAATASLPAVEVSVRDAADLDTTSSYDVVAASLVLFFVPDPLATLTTWVQHLRPTGRIGITTFGTRDETTLALDALLLPYAPPGLLDARTTGTSGPFASDEALADLFREAGASEVVTRVEGVSLPIADVATWERFSRSTGQRAMWMRVPDDERERLLEQAAGILTGEPLVWQVRYTVAGSTPSRVTSR